MPHATAPSPTYQQVGGPAGIPAAAPSGREPGEHAHSPPPSTGENQRTSCMLFVVNTVTLGRHSASRDPITPRTCAGLSARFYGVVRDQDEGACRLSSSASRQSCSWQVPHRPPRHARLETRKPVFAMYYLWWSAKHWQDRLGSNYPSTRTPAPLPATLNEIACGARHQLFRQPAHRRARSCAGYYQNAAAVIERDVRLAASMGLKGFAVNWIGTGSSTRPRPRRRTTGDCSSSSTPCTRSTPRASRSG